jgi:hypothetical protein
VGAGSALDIVGLLTPYAPLGSMWHSIVVLRWAHHREHLSRGRATVDKIEDAKSREFNNAQQGSTSRPHLIELEAVENGALLREAGIRLGHSGPQSVFNNLEIGHLHKRQVRLLAQPDVVRPAAFRSLKLEETASTILTTSAPASDRFGGVRIDSTRFSPPHY